MKGYAILFLFGFCATLALDSVAQQRTRVVCTNSLGQYQTFVGNCPPGWTFVDIAQ